MRRFIKSLKLLPALLCLFVIIAGRSTAQGALYTYCRKPGREAKIPGYEIWVVYPLGRLQHFR
jgi:hypothetical protein